MDLSSLLASHGDDEPSGENLEYDPAFTSLEIAAQPGEERQVGDSIIEAEEPDYAEVIALSQDVMARSHDLRAGMFLAYALLRTKGFVGFSQATAYVRGCLEQWWDTCHPQLDEDDDNDPMMRINAIRSLVDSNTVLRGVRLAGLTESRSFGRISLRDFQVAEGEISPAPGAESVVDLNQIAAAFKDTAPEKLDEIRAAVESAYADIKAIDAIFDEKTPGLGPDLGPLEKLLKQAIGRFSAAGIGAAVQGEDSGDDGADAGVSAASAAGARPTGGPAGVSVPGAVNSQDDVRTTIDRLIAYYQRVEPSSPVPMLLERAKRLVGADFYTIIKDMAPDGRENVKTVGGLVDDEAEEY